MKSFIFTPELSKAFIDGKKTQTRRPIKDIEHLDPKEIEDPTILGFLKSATAQYQVGDIVYLREQFRFPKDFDSKKPSEIKASPVEFKLGGTTNCVGDIIKSPGKWRSPLHLPERFARHFAKITEVRVERIQNISYSDAKHEGLDLIEYEDNIVYKNYVSDAYIFLFARNSFKSLWRYLYGEDKPKSWNTNPYVFVYSFVKCDKNGKEINA